MGINDAREKNVSSLPFPFISFAAVIVCVVCLRVLTSAYSDAGAARTPGFLLGGTFHYPDDAEQAIKWIRGKVHEMQR